MPWMTCHDVNIIVIKNTLFERVSVPL